MAGLAADGLGPPSSPPPSLTAIIESFAPPNDVDTGVLLTPRLLDIYCATIPIPISSYSIAAWCPSISLCSRLSPSAALSYLLFVVHAAVIVYFLFQRRLQLLVRLKLVWVATAFALAESELAIGKVFLVMRLLLTLGFLLGGPAHLVFDVGVDAQEPLAIVLEPVSVIHVGHMIDINEAMCRAQRDQPLLALHLHIVQELLVGHPQNVDYRLNVILVFWAESELSTVKVGHNLLEHGVGDV
eukprot:CAMPEP_0185568880 /NCGR_PEP_ID=MMETSP0434-20130131/1699_1 /TAXON_ID=626734 ORGANISM="Favella taraikaensis, Strain Fe Narragansett Bay" /NCGR_SAMPLE_ID=MMETSP0434 /ASSEMBLY_ACC=CAM_ASM_000379 /LENGTH=241 /DNA_ID=CAMNT_0028183515 /DNA_START=594 /DNA_END=1318 /DNA_ORIENTATION=+